MMEEASETAIAVGIYFGEEEYDCPSKVEIMDGIGDTVVTLILLADMMGTTLPECLQMAYDEIKGRKGKMVDGIFVKSVDSTVEVD